MAKRMQEGNLPYTGGWSTPAASAEGKEETIGPKAIKFAGGKATRWRCSHWTLETFLMKQGVESTARVDGGFQDVTEWTGH